MGKIKTIAAALALFGAVQAFADSPIWGTQTLSCSANSDTYIGITSTRAPVFAGKVQSVQGGTTNVVAVGEPNWAANQFVYSAGVQPNHYYLKFTSGQLEGAWYDIKSNGAYYLQIEIGNAELAKIAAGDSFEIIPHWTMATLFPNGADFVKATTKSLTGITYIYKYTKYEDGTIVYPSGSNNAPMASYYYRARSPYFNWMSDSTTVADDDIVEPLSVLVVRQPAQAASVSVNGVIPMCKASVLISNLSETDNTDNYFAVPSAVDINLGDLNVALIDSGAFVPQTSKSSIGVDNFYVYDNSAEGKNRAPAHNYYYKNRSGDVGWRENKTAVDSAVLESGTQMLIVRKRCIGDVAVSRIFFKPKYIKE